MRPAGIYKSYDLMTCISRSANFRLGPITIFVVCRFLSSVDRGKLVFY